MKILSVNQALEHARHKTGACLTVEGILSYEIEDIALYHWPKAEREDGQASSIWIECGSAVFTPNDEVLRRWNGKRVVILGTVDVAPESQMDGWDSGYGHFCMWPAQIHPRRIDLLKRWEQQHTETKDA